MKLSSNQLDNGKLGHQSKYSTCTLQFVRINLIPEKLPSCAMEKRAPGCFPGLCRG